MVISLRNRENPEEATGAGRKEKPGALMPHTKTNEPPDGCAGTGNVAS